VFFGGRIFGLLGYLLIVWLALRIAPRGRAVIFVVAVMPIAVQEASSYSADGMTISLALLSVALALRCCLDPTAGRRWFVALCAALVALALAKPSYEVFALLVFLMPKDRLRRSSARALLVKLTAFVVVLGTGAGWYLAVRNVTLAAYFPLGAIAPGTQFSYVVSHPLGYLHVLASSVRQGFSREGWVAEFVASTDDYPTNQSPALAIPFVVLAYAGIIAAYAVEVGPRLHHFRPSEAIRALVPTVMAGLGFVVVCTILWAQWTPVGSSAIGGIQGRYFLPIAALPVLTVALLTRQPQKRWGTTPLVLGMLILAIAEVVKVLGTFY